LPDWENTGRIELPESSGNLNHLGVGVMCVPHTVVEDVVEDVVGDESAVWFDEYDDEVENSSVNGQEQAQLLEPFIELYDDPDWVWWCNGGYGTAIQKKHRSSTRNLLRELKEAIICDELHHLLKGGKPRVSTRAMFQLLKAMWILVGGA
jgi:hypothetical protein